MDPDYISDNSPSIPVDDRFTLMKSYVKDLVGKKPILVKEFITARPHLKQTPTEGEWQRAILEYINKNGLSYTQFQLNVNDEYKEDNLILQVEGEFIEGVGPYGLTP